MNASEMAQALLLAIAPETALDLPRPHSGQQGVIADAQRFNVLAAGRRWGKNTLAEGRVRSVPATLVSGTVRDLVAGSGVRFKDRGTRVLKGVPGKCRLFAVDKGEETQVDR